MNDTQNSPDSDKISPKILEKNEVISISQRFNIMLVLYSNKEIGFTPLCKILNLTKGNLKHHLSYLVEIGWISERKILTYRPLTFFKITAHGESEFQEYILKIRDITKNF